MFITCMIAGIMTYTSCTKESVNEQLELSSVEEISADVSKSNDLVIITPNGGQATEVAVGSDITFDLPAVIHGQSYQIENMTEKPIKVVYNTPGVFFIDRKVIRVKPYHVEFTGPLGGGLNASSAVTFQIRRRR